jgi:lipid II:glycine glycyltransferase (peptidoglycan interpeptide bridge formation enzyme)
MVISFVEEIIRDQWNNFLIDNKGSFLQSWEWGNFQQNNKKRIWRLKVVDEGKIVALVLIVRETFISKLNHLYIPFGPVYKKGLSDFKKEKALQLILRSVESIAKNQKSIFLKIEPLEPADPLPKKYESEKIIKRIQPAKTIILNLTPSLDKIFANFHSRSRYNIKLSSRKGLKIIKSDPSQFKNNQLLFDEFAKLMTAVGKRKDFKPYPSQYYRSLFNILNGQCFIKLFLAHHKTKIVGGNMVVFFGRRATALHGAVDYKYRVSKVSHFLQWERIKEAKKQRCQEYDFWGIDEKKWPGITYFKKTFGGKVLSHPHGTNIIFRKSWYQGYKLSRYFKN